MPDRASIIARCASPALPRPIPASAEQRIGQDSAPLPAAHGAFLPEVSQLLSDAAEELKAHASKDGRCAACGTAFPCERVSLAEFTLGAVARDSPVQAPTAAHTWVFPGTTDQVRVARRVLATALGSCPAADDINLCLSELVTNAIRHSASADPGGTVMFRAEITSGAGVYLEVADDGGPWQHGSTNDGRLHGLGIVRSLATSLSISGSETDGWVIAAWFAWNPAPARPIGTS